MQINGPLDYFPLWALFLVTVAAALLLIDLGYRFGRYRLRRTEAEKEELAGTMVGAILGLLGFMLAFTFGLAANRFNDRRQLVVAEANAIGQSYLRALMISEPIRTESRNLLRDYVDVRLEAVESGDADRAISKSVELHQRLWSQAVAATEKDRSDITSIFVQSLNEVIDLHAKRVVFGLRSRIPGAIWIALYLLVFVAMASMGYHHGLNSPRRSPALLALVIAFSAVLILNVDLDRPREGWLRTSQQPIIDLRNFMSVPSPGEQIKDH